MTNKRISKIYSNNQTINNLNEWVIMLEIYGSRAGLDGIAERVT